MIRSKQTHTFLRKTGQLGVGRTHITKEVKYDIDFGIDEI